jgi:hypothetical protein
MDVVFPGESFHLIMLMLPDAAGKVGSYAYIQGATGCAGEDIDAGKTFSLHWLSLAGS